MQRAGDPGDKRDGRRRGDHDERGGRDGGLGGRDGSRDRSRGSRGDRGGDRDRGDRGGRGGDSGGRSDRSGSRRGGRDGGRQGGRDDDRRGGHGGRDGSRDRSRDRSGDRKRDDARKRDAGAAGAAPTARGSRASGAAASAAMKGDDAKRRSRSRSEDGKDGKAGKSAIRSASKDREAQKPETEEAKPEKPSRSPSRKQEAADKEEPREKMLADLKEQLEAGIEKAAEATTVANEAAGKVEKVVAALNANKAKSTAAEMLSQADEADKEVEAAKTSLQTATEAIKGLPADEEPELKSFVTSEVKKLQAQLSQVEQRITKSATTIKKYHEEASKKNEAELEKLRTQSLSIIWFHQGAQKLTRVDEYNRFDGKKNGKVEKSAFVRFFQTCRMKEGEERMSEDDADRLFTYLDSDGSTHLTKQQFLNLISRFFEVVKASVITDDVSTKSKTTRRLDKGEVLECLAGPQEAEGDIARFKVTCMSDGVVGWVTLVGNCGTVYIDDAQVCQGPDRTGCLAQFHRCGTGLPHVWQPIPLCMSCCRRGENNPKAKGRSKSPARSRPGQRPTPSTTWRPSCGGVISVITVLVIIFGFCYFGEGQEGFDGDGNSGAQHGYVQKMPWWMQTLQRK